MAGTSRRTRVARTWADGRDADHRGPHDACIDVLKKQIAAGKKKIAIFTAPATNPDFEKRLVRDFG